MRSFVHCTGRRFGRVFALLLTLFAPAVWGQDSALAPCDLVTNPTLDQWANGLPVGWSREPWEDALVAQVPGESFARVSRGDGGVAILKQRILEGQPLAEGDRIRAEVTVRSAGPGDVLVAVVYVFHGDETHYESFASDPHPNDGQFHRLSVLAPAYRAGNPQPDEIYLQVRSADAQAPFEVQDACGTLVNEDACGLVLDATVQQWNGGIPVFWSKEPWAGTVLERLDGSDAGAGTVRIFRDAGGVGILKQQLLKDVPLRVGDVIQARASVRAEGEALVTLAILYIYKGDKPQYKTYAGSAHPNDGGYHELEVMTAPHTADAAQPDQIFLQVRSYDAKEPFDVAHACGHIINVGL